MKQMPEVQHEEDTVYQDKYIKINIGLRKIHKSYTIQIHAHLGKSFTQNFCYIAEESMCILPKLTELQSKTLRIKLLINCIFLISIINQLLKKTTNNPVKEKC